MALEVDETASALTPPAGSGGFSVGAVVAVRYRIVASIGSGGMGEVFAVDDLVVGVRIALKALRSDRTGPHTIERLRRELALARTVTHPNVCRIHDLGDHEGRVFLTMELLDGETLADRIRRGSLALDEALAIVDQLVKGLAAAHAAGIVHRDFKSSNVMLVGGARPRAVVSDFGLARAEAVGERVDLTGEAMLGTPAYMAPEQVEGRPATAASDVYALGVVMFEMLTGSLPFRGESPLAMAHARLTADPPRVRSLRPEVSPAWDATIARCLARRPAERFARVDEVAAALRRRPPPSPAARRRRAIAATAIAVGGLAVGSGAIGYRLHPAPATVARVALDPKLTQVTFRRGLVYSARFAPDSSAIIYSAAWDGERLTTYSAIAGRPEARPLFAPGLRMQSIALDGRVALLGPGVGGVDTLAVGSLAGEEPRPIAENVAESDWAPRGDKPVVIRGGGERAGRIELPDGRTLFDLGGRGNFYGMRVSRDGARIALLQQDFSSTPQESLVVVDQAGSATVLLPRWRSLDGLAWSADGREVWVSGVPAGDQARALFGVDLHGKVREIWRATTALQLDDIAADGRVLLEHGERVREVVRRGPSAPRSLSWFDATGPIALSDAGDAMLFNESGEAVRRHAPDGVAYLRRLDGSLPIKLIDSPALALSPDGSRAIALEPGDKMPKRLMVVPTGAGESRVLPAGPIASYRTGPFSGAFSPDGRKVVTLAVELGPDQHVRLYVQDLAGGPPRAISPPDMELAADSRPVVGDHDVFVRDAGGTMRRFPIDGGPPSEVPALQDGTPLHWSPDHRVLVARPTPGDDVSATIHSVDPATGASRELYTIAPDDRAGVLRPPSALVTPDGATCVYVVDHYLSQLYVVEGLR